MRNLQEFLITDEMVEKLEDIDLLTQKLSEGFSLQQILGYPDDVLMEMYEVAVALYAEKLFEDCINAFVFLSTVNPNIPFFWSGLGNAYEQGGYLDKAIESHKTAIYYDPFEIQAYIDTARCLLTQEKVEEAIQLLDTGIDLAQVDSHRENNAELIQNLKALKEHIKNNQNK